MARQPGTWLKCPCGKRDYIPESVEWAWCMTCWRGYKWIDPGRWTLTEDDPPKKARIWKFFGHVPRR